MWTICEGTCICVCVYRALSGYSLFFCGNARMWTMLSTWDLLSWLAKCVSKRLPIWSLTVCSSVVMLECELSPRLSSKECNELIACESWQALSLVDPCSICEGNAEYERICGEICCSLIMRVVFQACEAYTVCSSVVMAEYELSGWDLLSWLRVCFKP